jgi:hypothetical protein
LRVSSNTIGFIYVLEWPPRIPCELRFSLAVLRCLHEQGTANCWVILRGFSYVVMLRWSLPSFSPISVRCPSEKRTTSYRRRLLVARGRIRPVLFASPGVGGFGSGLLRVPPCASILSSAMNGIDSVEVRRGFPGVSDKIRTAHMTYRYPLPTSSWADPRQKVITPAAILHGR